MGASESKADTTIVDEIFALNAKLNQGFSAELNQTLTSTLQNLSTAESKVFRDRCIASTFAQHWNLLGYSLQNGLGLLKDEKEAVVWYRKSGDAGNTIALKNLGHCLQHGIGVSKDETEAVVWYRKAAELGNTSAMNNLGYCLDSGVGAPKDEKKAEEWYKKANTGVAFWNLAGMYTDKDPVTALQYYCRAMSDYPEGKDRTECVENIETLMTRRDLRLEVLQRWIHRENEWETLKSRADALETENERLRTENERLSTEVAFQPGGVGNQKASDSFERGAALLQKHLVSSFST